MSYATILAQVKSILEGVTDIGIVHDNVRWAVDSSVFKDFLAKIDDEEQIRAWLITRVSGGQTYGAQDAGLGTQVAIPTQTRLRRHDFAIEGFQSFKDNSTEADWQNLVDAILNILEDNITLNSTCFLRGPISFTVDMATLGDYITHHALIEFYAVERGGITPS